MVLTIEMQAECIILNKKEKKKEKRKRERPVLTLPGCRKIINYPLSPKNKQLDKKVQKVLFCFLLWIHNFSLVLR